MMALVVIRLVCPAVTAEIQDSEITENKLAKEHEATAARILPKPVVPTPVGDQR